MAVKVSYDARKAWAKLKGAQQNILLASRKTAKTLAKVGVYNAARIAPYDTGATARAVNAKPTNLSANRTQWTIMAPDVHPEAAARLNGLVRYMHSNSSGAQNHFRKDRDRKFMYTTREYLNGIKTNIAKGNFSNISINTKV